MQKKRSSKTLYEGTIFTVTKDEVEIKGCVYERDICLLYTSKRRSAFSKQSSPQ